jgi:TonB family protein
MSFLDLRIFCLAILIAFGVASASPAKTLMLGTDYSSEYKMAEAVYHPDPEIPSELKEQCFKSCCIAKFLIKKDGSTSVHLLSTSGSPDVDDIALKALRHWKFKPATVNGEPVDSSRKIQIEFDVE